jgi:iron complex outermembrane receptor protein
VLLSGEYQKRTSMTQTLERNNFFSKTNGGTGIVQVPALLQYENFVVDRSRLGFNGSVQFEATPEFVITAEGLYSELTTGRHQDFLSPGACRPRGRSSPIRPWSTGSSSRGRRAVR